MVEAVKRDFPQREIADARLRAPARDRRAASGSSSASTTTREGDDGEIEILRIDPALERKQIDRAAGRARPARRRRRRGARSRELREPRRRERDATSCRLLACARAHATEGEIVEALQDVFGTYTETPVF